jgi:Tfp pilus assembly protein PilO
MTLGVRLLWALTAIELFGGGIAIESRYRHSIERSRAAAEALYRSTMHNERLIAQAAELRAAQAAAEADLQHISMERSLSAATASLLSTLEVVAAREHAEISGVDPGRTTLEDRLLATDLTLRVRGKFRNIVSFVEDVSRQAVLLKVSNTELAIASEPEHAPEPNLDATVHATLYRLSGAGTTGERRIASAP